MLNTFNKTFKVFFGLLASFVYLFAAGISSVHATKITWHYHDMHGEMTGAPKLTDPLTILVTFLIVFAIGLTIWIASKNADEKENEADDGVSKTMKASN